MAAQLSEAAGSLGRVVAPEDAASLRTELVRFREESPTAIVVSGGDGTLHRIIEGMVDVWGPEAPWPRLVILRGGTNNIVASSVGSRGRPTAA